MSGNPRNSILEPIFQKITENYQQHKADSDQLISQIEKALSDYRKSKDEEFIRRVFEVNGLTPPQTKTNDDAALRLYEAVNSLPEFLPADEIKVAVEEAEEDVAPTQVTWKNLAKKSQDQPILIFGGFVVEDKLKWLRNEGLEVRWVSNENGSRASGVVERTATQIKNNIYCLVLALDDLIGHHESRALQGACRESKTPLAFAKKAGVGRLSSILSEMERRFTP